MKPSEQLQRDVLGDADAPRLTEREIFALPMSEPDAAAKARAVEAILEGRSFVNDELERRRARRRAATALVAGVALAASVTMALSLRPIPGPSWGKSAYETDTELSTPAPATGAAAPIRLSRHAMLRLDFTPGSNASTDDEVSAWKRSDGGALTPLGATPVLQDQGQGPRRRFRVWLDAPPPVGIDLAAGRWQLVFVFAKKGHLPGAADVESALRRGNTGGNGWRLDVTDLEVVEK